MASENNLRPYYDHDTFNAGYLVIFKPGVGLIDTLTNKPVAASLGTVSSQAGKLLGGTFGPGKIGLSGMGSARSEYVAVDKNYVYDLELLEYFDVNNLLEVFKNLMLNFVKNYCKVLLSQPLEMVRLVLQVGYFNFSLPKADQKDATYTRLKDNVENSAVPLELSESEEDEIDYFGLASIPSTSVHWSLNSAPNQKVARNPHKIYPVSQHTVDIMTAIAAKDGPFALFRGINASFIHYTLSHTIEAWVTGLFSPFLNIPDPFFLDLTHSTEPLKSLGLSVVACVLAGLVLMPLDLIKVRMMLTPFNKTSPLEPASESSSAADSTADASAGASELAVVNTRSVRESIRHFPVPVLLNPPPTITLLTILHQVSTTVFRKAAPYLLFVRYNIDSYLSPSLYTLGNLVLLITELFIKLPVENLLRKEQLRFLLKPKSIEEDPYRVVTIDNPQENLIVTFNGWSVDHLLDEDNKKISIWTRVRLLGLFNGWRVGVLNVIGFWGYNIFKSSAVLAEERL